MLFICKNSKIALILLTNNEISATVPYQFYANLFQCIYDKDHVPTYEHLQEKLCYCVNNS